MTFATGNYIFTWLILSRILVGKILKIDDIELDDKGLDDISNGN